ncbi:DUF5004 domain-containing protein [Zhouia spongiae]|uniref:DUF5004 domain-containing protein n=1 Tax=Zhouia spongiae TaxID=2202721 RepID=A0ABY3YPR5_9FLAO|nr:DUF5004 domain-containing protein [Zhouia spongiae]UNY99830.1 DUF5004 domain-containing protein [Zhouia spongiae]
MMKLKTVSLLSLLMLGGVMLSCNSNDDVSCPEDFTGELTASEGTLVGDWSLSAIVAEEEVDLTDDEEDNPSTDIYAQQSDCQNDASYTFGTDRSFTFQQGNNAEECSNKGKVEGSWKLEGEQLSQVYYCSLQTANIDVDAENNSISFTNTVKITDVSGKVVETTITYTYTKQLEN